MIDGASWSAVWKELGAQSPDAALHRKLIACWSEKQRHYHTLQHLRECFEHFDAVRTHARRPGEIAAALWFHDAFYDPERDDNEERSARWLRECATEAGVDPAVGQRLHDMVMATVDHSPQTDGDFQLLVDIDLSILGAARGRFDESNEQIRREYAHVPEPEWRVARKRVLRGFLDRPRLYGSDRFHSMLEQQARANLQHALDGLDG